MVQGLAGWMSITGDPQSPPSKTGLSAVDFATGFASALALLAGLHGARATGVGCDCDDSIGWVVSRWTQCSAGKS